MRVTAEDFTSRGACLCMRLPAFVRMPIESASLNTRLTSFRDLTLAPIMQAAMGWQVSLARHRDVGTQHLKTTPTASEKWGWVTVGSVCPKCRAASGAGNLPFLGAGGVWKLGVMGSIEFFLGKCVNDVQKGQHFLRRLRRRPSAAIYLTISSITCATFWHPESACLIYCLKPRVCSAVSDSKLLT